MKLTDLEIEKEVNKGNLVIKNGELFHERQRRSLYIKAFYKSNKCRICGKREEIQIHHLYEYCNMEIIETYEDFLKIPWIPLCKKHHTQIHGFKPPMEAEND